ncbi:MAG: hypothetical protein MUE98_04605 [Rhodobacteraceae bacterium]|jgi:hypothetical protein|nr:hypothetical protein [Paracoccaceae bacterium]
MPIFCRLFPFAFTVLLPLAATAQDAPTPLTYAVFEATLPHLDLAECPATLGGADRFCRLALGHDALWVFAFSLDGDSPMVGVESVDPAGIEALLN